MFWQSAGGAGCNFRKKKPNLLIQTTNHKPRPTQLLDLPLDLELYSANRLT